jgi:ABC-type branched-subunit amino acid transport system ATPase component/ABC-type branched-subunit amino acid transport system permease subunit
MGIGAFAAAHVVAVHHWGFVAVLLFSGVVTAGAGVLIGLPAVRLRGVFLAVTTLALAVLGASWLFYQQEVGADAAGAATLPLAQVATPLGGALHSYRELYYVTLVVLGLAILSVRALRRSGPGRALVAARDNERAASASGVSVLGARLTALAISGFLAGVAGALWAMSQTVFSAAAFDAGHSLLMLSVAIVGGMGGLAGPVLGAFAVFGWPFLVPGQNNVVVQSLFSTVLLLVVLLRRPGGLVSLVESVRRRLVSSVADGPTPLADEPAAPQPAAEDELPAATASARFAPVPGSRPLVVEDLAISFGGVRALDGVTLTVGPGEIVGLIGGNGAGKTTLMNCVSGHLRPTSGRVELFGQDVTDLPPQFRPVLSVARSFQDAALYPGLTVLETAMVPMDGRDRSGTVGALLGAPWTVAGERRKQAAAMSVLSTFGLGDRAATLTSELSTGMRRLVDFSAIVAARPALVLLDEPTAGIAQREVEEFGALLRDLRETLDCAIVLIEHDMPLVMSVCDRVYCLSSGSVVAEGTPEQVQTDPAVIASYLGTDQAAIARSGAST